MPFDTAQQNTIFFDKDDVASMRALEADISSQIDWILGHPDDISNPITLAAAFERAQINAEPQDAMLLSLARRVSALEDKRSDVAFAISGQGELATKNFADVERIWKINRFLEGANWQEGEDGQLSTHHNGFRITLRPQSGSRWSSSAIEDETGHSISYPPWQASITSAKKAIAENIIQYLDLKDT